MKFHIAETLQQRWVKEPPAGWVASREVGVVSQPQSRMPGYQPKADLMLQNAVTRQIGGNRVQALGLIKRFDLSSPISDGKLRSFIPFPGG